MHCDYNLKIGGTFRFVFNHPLKTLWFKIAWSVLIIISYWPECVYCQIAKPWELTLKETSCTYFNILKAFSTFCFEIIKVLAMIFASFSVSVSHSSISVIIIYKAVWKTWDFWFWFHCFCSLSTTLDHLCGIFKVLVFCLHPFQLNSGDNSFFQR